jgi:glycosyltransferase A (GT-A) superfamily protein (DUF2064 family)
MLRAVRDAVAAGSRRIVLIGTDCPDLGSSHVRDALAGLDEVEVVLGPARDGGYYLLATRRALPMLFDGIEWGAADVLDRTLRRARRANLSVRLLEPLADVDRPEDLAIWEGRPPSD